MSDQSHANHSHVHASGCGHTAVMHGGHVDYLHDGHLHHMEGERADEHEFDGPTACTPSHACGGHDGAHRHGPGCGHEAAPHAGHVDYVVGNHLHHSHSGHCDDHGAVRRA